MTPAASHLVPHASADFLDTIQGTTISSSLGDCPALSELQRRVLLGAGTASAASACSEWGATRRVGLE